MDIFEFQGEYRFLSNFWPSEVEMDGLIYPTVEHAYQAAKTLDIRIRKIILDLKTPAAAKKFAKTISLRPDWSNIKIGIMEDLVRKKFVNNISLSSRLLNTGEGEIIEGNSWNDTFWGVCNGKGKNHLGKILMKIRSELACDF